MYVNLRIVSHTIDTLTYRFLHFLLLVPFSGWYLYFTFLVSHASPSIIFVLLPSSSSTFFSSSQTKATSGVLIAFPAHICPCLTPRGKKCKKVSYFKAESRPIIILRGNDVPAMRRLVCIRLYASDRVSLHSALLFNSLPSQQFYLPSFIKSAFHSIIQLPYFFPRTIFFVYTFPFVPPSLLLGAFNPSFPHIWGPSRHVKECQGKISSFLPPHSLGLSWYCDAATQENT